MCYINIPNINQCKWPEMIENKIFLLPNVAYGLVPSVMQVGWEKFIYLDICDQYYSGKSKHQYSI